MRYSLRLAPLNVAFMLFCSVAIADSKKITISDQAGYYDEKIIQSNIRSECVELGRQFSDSTNKYLAKNKWDVVRSDELPSSGYGLELSITNALSAGNAWAGHRKSVSIEAKLYKDDELLDSYVGTRDSGGGFGAGFKSSCDVLKRCVNTLGKDVSKWLKKKNIK